MKLIRDKIPMLMNQSGVKFEARIADNDEYKELLVQKMQEEVKELMEDQDLEEAADVYEVFLALIKECILPISDQKYSLGVMV